MRHLAMVADDFTGALDAGVQCAKAGLSCVMQVLPADGSLLVMPKSSDVSVWVIDTESRHLEQREAMWRVRTATTLAQAWGADVFFKKIDSALRGNCAAEIAAMAQVCGANVHVAPAYPALRRITQNGHQYIEGLPVEQSAFARDVRCPVREGNLRDMLLQFGIPYTFYDACSQADMTRNAQIIQSRGAQVLAGCAGLAMYLPDMLDEAPRRAILPPPASAAPLLVVGGSMHPHSRAQLQACQVAGWPCVDVDDALPPIDALLRQMRQEGVLVLRTPDAPMGQPAPEQALAQIAAGILERMPHSPVFVFGGDTACALHRKLGGGSITPIMEICDGVPVSYLGSRLLVTKAGGFDGRDILPRVRAFLQTR
nr:four-carbon acid sugar kinase family protein [Maliibacterium massiliense]